MLDTQRAEIFAPVKVETIPLLSPTMESELMREPWSFPREPASSMPGLPMELSAGSKLGVDGERAVDATSTATNTTTAGTNNAGFSNSWEENFQDLSDWCMANQTRCDFRAGESTIAAKLTGMINNGTDVITAVDAKTRGYLMHQQQAAIGKKIINNNNNKNINNNSIGIDSIAGVRRPLQATCVVVPTQLDHAYTVAGQQQQQQQQNFYNNNTSSISTESIETNLKNNAGNVWMGLPARNKPVTQTSTSNNINNNNSDLAWQEFGDLGITVPSSVPPVYQQQQQQPPSGIIDFDIKRDNPDVFQALDNDASNGFDLLSYLCEDDIPSPNDSISTDSSRVTDVASLPSGSSARVVVSPKTYEPITLSATTSNDALKSRLHVSTDSPFSHDSPKHSPLSTGSSDAPLITRSSYRQLRPIIKIEKPESPEPMMERRTSTNTRSRRTRTISSTSSRTSSVDTRRGRKRNLDDDSDSEDGMYRETREKNNEASRKSRMNKKAKEVEMSVKANELEKDNRILKMKVEELEKLVTSMRNALLRSALKREVKTNRF